MTFAQIHKYITLKTGTLNYDLTALLRDAEYEFILRTHCLIKPYSIDTDVSGLSATYSTPSDFLALVRAEWKGVPLTILHQKTNDLIYKTDGDEYTGVPAKIGIENDESDDTQKFRLIPEPSASGIITMMYVYYNTTTDGTSPIIPAIEHRKLANYVIKEIFEAEAMTRSEAEAAALLQKAQVFENKWEAILASAYSKYRKQHFSQRRIKDVVGSEGIDPFSIQNRVGTIPEP